MCATVIVFINNMNEKIFQFQLIMKFLKENDINKKTYEIEFEGIPKEITSQTIKKL